MVVSMNDQEKFLSKTRPVEGSDCVEWAMAKFNSGYGAAYFGGKLRQAHRVSFELFKARIPSGLFVLHSCDNRLCVNPEHLYAGTQKQNAMDRERRGRLKHKSGEEHYRAKLSKSDIEEIRLSTEKQRVIAEIYGISQPHVSSIQRGKSWSAVPASLQARRRVDRRSRD